MKTDPLLIVLIQLAGIGQVFIALIYERVRTILEWDQDIRRMRHPWNRQIAHTYSRYIQSVNFAFGVISICFAPAFFESNAIATALALVIALYWAGRLVVAIALYDTRGITSQRRLYRYGAVAFNTLFAYLAITYSLAFLEAVK